MRLSRGAAIQTTSNISRPLDEEQARVVRMQLLPGLTRDLAPHFVNKSWLVYSPSPKQALYISDNGMIGRSREPAVFQATLVCGDTDPVGSDLRHHLLSIRVYNHSPHISILCKRRWFRSGGAGFRFGFLSHERLAAAQKPA